MGSKTQFRGNCPICGREHAVVKGVMSKHGYTVEYGWFQGVCYGNQFVPMQQSRTATEKMVSEVRQEIAELRILAKKLESGEIKPEFVVLRVRKNGKFKDEFVPFAKASEYEQILQIKRDIFSAETRADNGERFTNDMMILLKAVHGTPLREVDLEASKPSPILIGETRISLGGRKCTVTRVDGARVYWNTDDGLKGRTGSSLWRKFDIAI